jgi:hypothetical protein
VAVLVVVALEMVVRVLLAILEALPHQKEIMVVLVQVPQVLLVAVVELVLLEALQPKLLVVVVV